jgi:CysZ protein
VQRSASPEAAHRLAANREPRANVFVQFFAGMFALAHGLSFLRRTRSSWPLAAVPMVVCAVLCSLALAGSIEGIPRLLLALWPGLANTLGHFGAGVVRFVTTLLAALLGLFLAAFLTPPLSAPALDRLVLVRERDLGVPPRPAAGFFRELGCAVQAQLLSVAVFAPMLAVLWVIAWAFPPALIVTLPLKALTLSAMFAWSLLDYPLSLRGLAAKQRLALLRTGWPRVLGFGAVLALVFAVPFFPLLFLPAAVAAAAEIAVALER